MNLSRTFAVIGFTAATALWGCSDADSADSEPAAVSEAEALDALDEMRSIAAERTMAAMERLCDLSLDDCHGFSGATIAHAESAPGTDDSTPAVLCSRPAGQGAWMLVVEGNDGYGRPYVSQVVLDRDDDGNVVPAREPDFWLGITYAGRDVTGSTGWSTAHHPQEGVTAQQHTEEMLNRARQSCRTRVEGAGPGPRHRRRS